MEPLGKPNTLSSQLKPITSTNQQSAAPKPNPATLPDEDDDEDWDAVEQIEPKTTTNQTTVKSKEPATLAPLSSSGSGSGQTKQSLAPLTKNNEPLKTASALKTAESPTNQIQPNQIQPTQIQPNQIQSIQIQMASMQEENDRKLAEEKGKLVASLTLKLSQFQDEKEQEYIIKCKEIEKKFATNLESLQSECTALLFEEQQVYKSTIAIEWSDSTGVPEIRMPPLRATPYTTLHEMLAQSRLKFQKSLSETSTSIMETVQETQDATKSVLEKKYASDLESLKLKEAARFEYALRAIHEGHEKELAQVKKTKGSDLEKEKEKWAQELKEGKRAHDVQVAKQKLVLEEGIAKIQSEYEERVATLKSKYKSDLDAIQNKNSEFMTSASTSKSQRDQSIENAAQLLDREKEIISKETDLTIRENSLKKLQESLRIKADVLERRQEEWKSKVEYGVNKSLLNESVPLTAAGGDSVLIDTKSVLADTKTPAPVEEFLAKRDITSTVQSNMEDSDIFSDVSESELE